MKKMAIVVALALLAFASYIYFPKQPAPAAPLMEVVEEVKEVEEIVVAPPPVVEVVEEEKEVIASHSAESALPSEKNRMHLLFSLPASLPFLETVTYVSRVPWLEGRAAYLGDYAAHYKTSKHFISKSLRGNYHAENVSKGERFNVLSKERALQFHLVLDLSRLKLWTYCYDETENKRYYLAAYPVCAGQLCKEKLSGSLTPLGTYLLGEGIAVYKEGVMGTRHGLPVEMITLFGKRWIPFAREIAGCTEPCKGLGIHGVPWKRDAEKGLTEFRERVGTYDSEGCICLLTEDMEELFAVIVSRPTYIHIVKDFIDAVLPGTEA